MIQKRRDIAIYKANSKNTGAAAQFKMGSQNDCMFLEIARQVAAMDSATPYDWEKKIIVKLGTPDITKMLAYLKMLKPTDSLKLFHKTSEEASKTVELKYQEYNGKPSYYLSVSAKTGEQDAVKISLPLAFDEAEFLIVGFTLGLQVILGW